MSWLAYPVFFQNAGHLWLRLSCDFALRSFLLLLVIFCLYQAARRLPSAFRHFLLSLAFVCLILLPVFFAFGPTWQLPILEVPSWTSGFEIASARLTSGSLALLLFGIWSLGFGVVLFRLLVGLWVVNRVTRESLPVDDPVWSETAAACRKELGLRVPVRLLANHRLGAAICAGIRRPAVVLPAAALDWNEEQRHTILCHELGHIKRLDNLTNVLALIVCAVYWFNPLVWWAAGRLRICREAACDDLVLGVGARPSHYVSYLLQATSGNESGPLSVALSQVSALKKRVLTILDPGVNRRKIEPTQVIACLLLAATALLSLAALQPWIIPVSGTGLARALGLAELPGVRLASELLLGSPAGSELRGELKPGERRFIHVPPGTLGDRQGPRLIADRQPTRVSSVGDTAGRLPFRRTFVPSAATQRTTDPVWASSASFDAPVAGGFLLGGPGQPGGDKPTDETPPASQDPPSHEPPDLEVNRLALGTLGGAQSLANDINEAGRVVGASTNELGENRPFIWSKSAGMVDLPCPTVDCQAIGINNQSQVLVIGKDESGTRSSSYVWAPDQPILDIGTLGGKSTRAVHLNDRAQIAGTSLTSFGTESAFFWSRETGMVNLGGSQAMALNERGQVAAWASSYAFFWDPETRNFSRIGGLDVKALPIDMNNRGEVVGYAQFGKDPQPKAFYWNPDEEMIRLPFPAEVAVSCAVRINDAGEVLAIARDPNGKEQAFSWRRGQEVRKEVMADLLLPQVDWNQLSRVNSPMTLIGSNLSSFKLSQELAKVTFASEEEPDTIAQPIRMNGRGQIAGNLVNAKQGETQAVVWEIRLPKLEETLREVASQVRGNAADSSLTALLTDALAALEYNDYEAAASSLNAFLEDLPNLTIPEKTRARWEASVSESLDRLSHFTILR